MQRSRTISADIADLASSWLSGLALAFEQTTFHDHYVRDQAPVNAATLRTIVEAINGAGWVDSGMGVTETHLQIMLAIDQGEVPPQFRTGDDPS